MNRKKVLYLLGSGRSGTTLIATILNSHPEIITLGEIHQFYKHIYYNLNCSCGSDLENCEFWGSVFKNMNLSDSEKLLFYKTVDNEEKHKFIPLLIAGKKASSNYLLSQNRFFESLEHNSDIWLLDSSKYIGRYLLLNQNSSLKIKGVYVVRDVRGVIFSFSKQVQTPKNAINTILYYILTNIFGQLICWIKSDVIKIRYEDFVENTPNEITRLLEHINLKEAVVENMTDKSYDMPHIIGGNRIKSNKSIKIKRDYEWKNNISRTKQIIYYIACFPIMLLNKYKI